MVARPGKNKADEDAKAEEAKKEKNKIRNMNKRRKYKNR